MKVLRLSMALSVSLLFAAPHARAAGDPNLDSGVGTAASRGPYGFNNTGNIPMYDQPPNNYGVFRDVYGGFRDSGMIPDNLFVKVPELTWEQAHPPGPPKLMGSPGGLGGGGFASGLPGLSGGGFGLPLGTSLGAFGAFTGIAPLAAAATASLTSPLPAARGSGLGPAGGAARTAYGFAGAPAGVAGYPYTGGPYLGAMSGYLVNPRITASNTTSPAGVSSSNWTWNTTYGPATLTEVSTPNKANTADSVVDSFTMNGNTYSTTTNVTNPSGTTGTTPLFPGFNFLPAPPVNGSISSNLTTQNAQQNPLAVNGANGFVNQNALAQTTEPGNFGSMFATPQTAGNQQSPFWTNNFGNGNFGSMFAGPQTDGAANSVFFNGNFNQGNFGSMFATPQTDGSANSFRYPNPNISNGIGIASGSLGTVGYGLPGFASSGYGSYFPGLGSGTSYGYAGMSGYPYVGGMLGSYGSTGSQGGNGELTPSAGSNVFLNDISSNTGGVGYFSDGTLARAAGANTNIDYGTGANDTVGGAGAPAQGGGAIGGPLVPYLQGSAMPGIRQGIGVLPPAAIVVPPAPNDFMTESGIIERTPGGTGTQWSVQSSEQPSLPPGIFSSGSFQPSGVASGWALRRKPVVCDNSPDGACGFFGGLPAAIISLNHGLNEDNRLPYLGMPISPLGMYAAARNLAIRLDSQTLAAGSTTPATTLTTELAQKLAARHIPLDQAIGRVIGSLRLTCGDIITYGTGGTLHLAVDNSGSLTFNDGEVITFKRADPCVRRIALQSTLIF